MVLLKKFRIISVLLILALALCAMFSSCSDEQKVHIENGFSFTDALGRTVTINKKPQRVAALLGSFADIWNLAGGTLCAAAEDASTDFGLNLENIVNIGGAHSPSIELLLSSNPDFVIASASTASNVDMKETLEAAGITVAYFDVDNFNDYLKMLDICTHITGRKDLFQQNGIYLKNQIESIKSTFAHDVITENERRILLLRASSGSVKAKGSEGTILGEMLADIGCINIADNDKSLLENLSIEAIIKGEPHHIFIVTMGNDMNAATKSIENMINDNPAWSTLKAVKENRVHLMDKTLFNLKPNKRWAEAYQTLYETLTKKSE